MILPTLKKYLDDNNIHYVCVSHSPAFTASEVAYKSYVPHQNLAKAVIVKIDGRLAMAVLPAAYFVDLERLRSAVNAGKAELAHEYEFERKFPDCEVGAMPPFGNLYDLPVFLSRRLSPDHEVAFTAGSHREIVKLAMEDFLRLVQPQVCDF